MSEEIFGTEHGTNETRTYALRGEGQQGALQVRFLKEAGFSVEGHGALSSQEDWIKAITAIWEERVPGWWNYQQDLLDQGICTQAEFSQALVASVAGRM